MQIHKEVSIGAVGLYTVMRATEKHDWTRRELEEETGTRPTTVRNALRELRDAGYVAKEYSRKATGPITGVYYYAFENKIPEGNIVS